MKKSSIGLVVFLLMAMWAGLAQASDQIMVEDAWIREAPPGAAAMAGYMILHNHGDSESSLVSAASPAFGSVQLHRTVMEEGMAKMVHQKAITVPAGGSVTFKPNDYHLMLMKPKQALKAGETVEVTLQFENGKSMTVPYEVRSAGKGMEHGAMNRGHMEH